MNLENHVPSEKMPISPKRVLDVCQRFADILAGGQWYSSRYRDVSTIRTFTEVKGRLSKANEDLREIKVRTTATFKGEKEVALVDEDGEPILEEFYTMSIAEAEVIDYTKLPLHIMATFAESVDLEESEDVDEADGDGARRSVKLTPEMLSNFIFEYEHEIGYTIDEEGELANYTVTVRYRANDDVIDEAHFAWDDKNGSEVFESTFEMDEKVMEWKAANLPTLSEAEVAEFSESFEATIQKLSDLELFDRSLEQMAPEESEHFSRVLAIVALAASGFKKLKI